jgi:hypothetical protein
MSRTDRFEHIRGGIEISCASHSSTGTLGYIVRDNSTLRAAILTNRHVVREDEAEVKANVKLIMDRAKYNSKKPGFCDEKLFDAWQRDYNKGDWRSPVFQPGFKGGLNGSARLVAFVGTASNVSDAALCPVVDGVQYATDAVANPHYAIPGAAAPKEGLLVMKSGKVSGVTYGKIKQISGEIVMIEPIEVTSQWPRQVYNPEDFMSFTTGANKLISDHGDSGSIWVSAETDYYPRCAVALLFKGDKKFSYAYDIRTIMTKLNFSFTDSLDILD